MVSMVEQFIQIAVAFVSVWWVFHVADELKRLRKRIEELEKGNEPD